MTLGHWEYFFEFPASTSTSTGGGFAVQRRLIGAGLAITMNTDVRL